MRTADLLLFTAHCDDGELWAGGTIARMVQSGKRVILAVANHNPTRRCEAEFSAKILGCEAWFRGGDVSPLDWAQQSLEAAAPEVLATHSIRDPHFEHANLSAVIIQALTKLHDRKAYPRRWYSFDTYYSTVSEGFPVLIDISGHFEQKVSALRCHQSQGPDGLVEMARTMNSLHGQRIRADYAEAFHVFPLLGRWPRLRDLP
ncbi:MAG: PIG-L deacetylase family protein [Alphaproteobacteria bacterium]